MTYRSITRRWLFNSLGVIVIALILVEVGVSLGVKNYYYSSASQLINLVSEGHSKDITEIVDDSRINFRNYLRTMVENFNRKDQMEMMGIGYSGQVLVTSSGFSSPPVYEAEDYKEALQSGVGWYEGKSESGEKILAMTMVVPEINSDFSAIRYVVSLEKIDRVVALFILILTGVMLAILVLVLISSSYFIKSIVIPVREVGMVAREFAAGDMSARILKKSNDEIGELCDIINYMADEIQNSEQVKNEFISSVSHELRTPLTAIKGWGETLMTMGPEDVGMLKKGMRVIISETERLSNMVEELLDFSRIQSGRFTLVKTKIDLLAELEDAVLIYTERARRDNKTLIYTEPENLSFVFGDRNRLKQVFINIIDNALKYSDSGDTVTVTVEEKDGFIWVKVSDTGIGIAQEDLSKVKEKFYKADTTRRGSGIGLAVASEIVQMHDGELLVQSELNVGTTVTIKLPMMDKTENRITEITSKTE